MNEKVVDEAEAVEGAEDGDTKVDEAETVERTKNGDSEVEDPIQTQSPPGNADSTTPDEKETGYRAILTPSPAATITLSDISVTLSGIILSVMLSLFITIESFYSGVDVKWAFWLVIGLSMVGLAGGTIGKYAYERDQNDSS